MVIGVPPVVEDATTVRAEDFFNHCRSSPGRELQSRSVQKLDLIEMMVLRSSSNLVHSIRR